MTAFQIPEISTEDLRSEALLVPPEAVKLRLVGTAESSTMAALSGLLTGLHAEAVSHHVREVTVDLRDLEFMNSSCFKAFVSWVGRIEDLDTEQQYRIRFLSDPKKHWQERSLGALACFATHLIRIES
jgi:hypothetical protein